MFNEDFYELIRQNPQSVADISYKPQPNATAQLYYGVAAQNNPEFAQALGDIHNMRSSNQAIFNAKSDYLQGARRRKMAEDQDAKNKAFAKNQEAQRRKWQLADRDHQEWLDILEKPDEEILSLPKDWENNAVNPLIEQKTLEYNNLARDIKKKSRNKREYFDNQDALKNKRLALSKLMNDMRMNRSPIKKVGLPSHEEIYGKNSLKSKLFNMVPDFMLSDEQIAQRNQANADARNIIMENRNPLNAGLFEKLPWHKKLFPAIGLSDNNNIRKVKDFMDSNMYGTIGWSESPLARSVAKQLQTNPDYAEINNLSNLVLLGNEADMYDNSLYAYDKTTDNFYRITVDRSTGMIEDVVEGSPEEFGQF